MQKYPVKTNQHFIGREFEKNKLLQLAASNEPAIVIVHGRRRIGKTELIEQALKDHKILKFEGREKRPAQEQREIFLETLAGYTGNRHVAKFSSDSWREILELLAEYLEKEPMIIFLEEFQWLCCYQTELIGELKVIWDNRLRHIPGCMLILCGSSPSFMIREVVYSKALYNRSIHEIALKPFTLQETSQFLGARFSKADALDAQLAVGGIPEYLKYIRAEKALIPGIVKNAFLPKAIFCTEKSKIFLSALAENVHYEKIIDFLAQKRYATRPEIASFLKTDPGGSLSKLLKDLEICGFIEAYTPLTAPEHSINLRYRISDNYLQFFFRFIHPRIKEIENAAFVDNPLRALNLTAYHQYLGLAFERWCSSQSTKIAEILGFSGVDYKSGLLFKRQTKTDKQPGWQVDLAFRRADRVLTLCELKHTTAPIDEQTARMIIDKFALVPVPARFNLQRVLISTHGATEKVTNGAFFDRVIGLEQLF